LWVLVGGWLLAAVPCTAEAREAPGRLLVVGSPSAGLERALERGLAVRRLRPVRPGALEGRQGAFVAQRKALVERVEARRRQAEDLFHKVKPGEAEQLLAEEITRSSEGLVHAGRFDLLQELHLWRGICLSKSGETDRAREAFGQAVLLDQRPLDTARFPPAVTAAHAREIEALSRLPRGTLRVVVSPAGARVKVNGRTVDPRGVQLPIGRHWMVVEAVGYMPAVRRVEIGTRPTALRVALEPAPPSLVAHQLSALRARGALDPTRPFVAALLARLERIDEALVVTEQRSGDRVQLALTRVQATDGAVVGRFTDNTASAQLKASVDRGLLRLWPLPSPPVVPPSTPVYKRWWFWTIVGTLVVGGTVGAVLGATLGGER
jgi:tetratricopeptide (TPR) repeat protein